MPSLPRSRSRRPRLPALRPLCLFALVLGLLVAPAGGAEVLDFEGQTSGPVTSVVEGDYEFGVLNGSILTAPGTGLYLASQGSLIGFNRLDFQPFTLSRIHVQAPFGFGTVEVTGVTAASGPVVASFPVFSTSFALYTLPPTFTDLVSVGVTVSGLPFGVDDVEVTIPPGTPTGTPGTLVLVSDDRSVSAFGQVCDEVDCLPPDSDSAIPSPAFAYFDASVAGGDGGNASQTSSASTGLLAGSGQAEGYSDYGYGYGDSSYDLTFRLDAPARIQLSGSLTAEDTYGFGYGESRVSLERGAQVLFQESADPYEMEVAFAYDEALPPGEYRLFVQADGEISIRSTYDFVLAADPLAAGVPAAPPAALWLLAAGLAALGAPFLERRR